jgi:hypothetical protein
MSRLAPFLRSLTHKAGRLLRADTKRLLSCKKEAEQFVEGTSFGWGWRVLVELLEALMLKELTCSG